MPGHQADGCTTLLSFTYTGVFFSSPRDTKSVLNISEEWMAAWISKCAAAHTSMIEASRSDLSNACTRSQSALSKPIFLSQNFSSIWLFLAVIDFCALQYFFSFASFVLVHLSFSPFIASLDAASLPSRSETSFLYFLASASFKLLIFFSSLVLLSKYIFFMSTIFLAIASAAL